MKTRRALPPLALLVLLAAPLAPSAQEPEVGRLLVATSGIDDSSFDETVLLLLIHQEQASLAVALNRPTWLDAAETFPQAAALAGYPGALFRGGPVAPTQLLLLIEVSGQPPPSTQRIVGSIYLGNEPNVLRDLDLTGEDPPRVRLYAGYAVWGPGQLVEEIAAGNWRVVPARPELIFSDNPETLWRRLPSSIDGLSAASKEGSDPIFAIFVGAE